ncbi:MAG: YncE family protein [Bacteroidales bacterium]|nr:YncE family protein [Bacteroidales bacterium]
MSYGPREEETFSIDLSKRGLFVMCEGNYMYGNASLSYYDPDTRQVQNEVFARSNAFPIGDVVQSMVMHGGLGWVVVNNSGVVFAIDPATFREVRRITGFTSPRYIHFLDANRAYVTQIWDPRIYIVDTQTCSITGYIDTGMDFETGSTEMMVQIGKYVYVNCWSYQNRILKIDTGTDTIVEELVVGIQPSSLLKDCNDKLWTITDGGYEESPYGYERATLSRIDAETFVVEQTFEFKFGDAPRALAANGDGTMIYWINGGIYAMKVSDGSIPDQPLISAQNELFYSLTVDPVSGEIYASDAIDYTQNGIVKRYSSTGILLDTFSVGINPGNFCWREAM